MVGWSVYEQETELCKQCAELIATKICELENLIEADIPDAVIDSIVIADSPLSYRVGEHLGYPRFCWSDASKKKMQNRGHHRSVNDERVAAHKTPWASIKEYIINIGTKSLFLMAMADLQCKWDGPFPIRVKIEHNRVQALATQTIKAGELFVPLLVMNPRSVVAENATIMTPLRQEPLFAEIAWSEFQYPVRFMIQPEYANLCADGSIQEVPPDVHPFWFIQRTGFEPHRSSLGPCSRSNARITTRDFHVEKSG